jgi:hypothetical protein
MNVNQDLEDAEEFEKAKLLAQLWQKTNMPREHKDQAVEEISNSFKWMRKKNKNFDLDAVQNKKVDDIRKIFNVWGGKKNRKTKVVAREIEDALDWWRRNDYELDDDASPAEEEKMRRLETLAQYWNNLAHPASVPATGTNLDWFRNQKVEKIGDTLNVYENSELNTSPRKFVGAMSEEQKRANEMASALDWLRNNNTELDADDDVSVALSVATFKKIDSLMPKNSESGVTSMEGALAWLRSKTDVDDQTVDSFKKIDDIMVKSGVKNSIEESGFGGALDWLRKRQAMKAANAEDGSMSSNEKFRTLNSKPMTEEQIRAAEMADQLDWLRSNDAADDIDDDMSLSIGSVASFKNIDMKSTSSGVGALPSALDWLRKQDNKSVEDSDDDDEDFNYPSFTGNNYRSAEQKKADDMIKALDWLRDGVQEAPDDGDDFKSVGSGTFSPLKIGGSDTSEVDDALNWLRQKHPESLLNIEDEDKFSLLSATTLPRSLTEQQQKAQQMTKALNWLRTNDVDYEDELPNFSDIFDKYGSMDSKPTVGTGETDDIARQLQWLRDTNPNHLDTPGDLLPHLGNKRKTQEQEKAEAMAKALAWLRNKSVSTEDEDDTNFDFEKYDIGDFAGKSQDERGRDRQDALDWLRNPGSDIDMDEKFKKLNLLLPMKEGQSSERRAKEMEDALNWLRSKGVDLDEDIGDLDSFKKLGIIPTGLQSMYENERDFRNAMNWIRNPGDDIESQNAFTKLDSVVPRREKQGEKERAQDMAKALAWCRENGVDLYSDSDSPAFDKINFESFLPNSSVDRKKKDFDDALNWLRNRSTDDSLDPSGVFQKLESSLPAREGRPLRERAQDIANALTWMRNKGLVPEIEIEGDVPALSKMSDTAFLSKRSPEQRAKDLSDALNWLRTKGEEGNDFDSTGDFSKLDSILPHKRNQTPEERAKDIEAALDWIRGNQSASFGDDDNVQGFNKFPLSGVATSSPEQRLEDLNNALTWIRKGKGKSKKYDTTGDFRKLDKLLPKKRGQTTEERAREIEGALDFLRSNNASPDDDHVIDKYSDLGSIPVSSRTPEQRHKDLQDALNWIRHKGENDAINDPDGCFQKLDAVLPEKKNQKKKARARQIEQFLDWTRGPIISNDDDSIPAFGKVESINANYRSPEERSQDIEKVMNWLRRKGKKDKKYDPTGDFRKIDMLLPKKKNQPLEDRARAIEGAMDYIRHNGVSLTDDSVVKKTVNVRFHSSVEANTRTKIEEPTGCP